MNFDKCNIQLNTKKHGPALLLENIAIEDSTVNNILHNADAITFNSIISGTTPNIKTQLALKCGLGELATRLTITGDSTLNRLACYGQIESNGIDVSKILAGSGSIR